MEPVLPIKDSPPESYWKRANKLPQVRDAHGDTNPMVERELYGMKQRTSKSGEGGAHDRRSALPGLEPCRHDPDGSPEPGAAPGLQKAGVITIPNANR